MHCKTKISETFLKGRERERQRERERESIICGRDHKLKLYQYNIFHIHKSMGTQFQTFNFCSTLMTSLQSVNYALFKVLNLDFQLKF